MNTNDEMKLVPPATVNENATPITGNLISVDFMSFIRSEKTTWEELFHGFNDVKIMTYSFGLPYLSKLMKFFDSGEVIVNPSAIRSDSAELMATQGIVTNFLCKETYLQKRMEENTFHMYVARDIISHAKIYLLKSNDGRTRTIFASANASDRAWNGSQIENYGVCDDPSYYESLIHGFELTKELSTDEISYKAKPIHEDGSNVEELPIIKKIQEVKTAIVIHDSPTKETEFAFTVEKLSDKFRTILTQAKVRPTIKDGGTLFTPAKVKHIVKISDKIHMEKKKRQITCPQLEIDYVQKKIILNDVIQNLSPTSQEVKSDIECWLKYLNGFDAFTGDTNQLKEKAWRILVHTFASPFFAALRYYGSQAEISFRRFPIYLLLHGPTDNGKTELLKTIQKLMLGVTPVPLDQKYFSTKSDTMPALKVQVKGCPILIDDINNLHWKYASDITKGDGFLVDTQCINHPTFLLTANDIGTIKPEVSKRLVVIYVNNQLSKNVAAAQNGKIVSLRNNMTTAFYRAYLAKMFPIVENMCTKFLDPATDSNWQPDIYEASSSIIAKLMQECNCKVPEEFRIFTWDDYMGDSAVSEQAIMLLKEMYHLNPTIFTVNSPDNEIIIDLSNLPDKSDISKRLRELPATLERYEIGNKIRLNLTETTYYTGLQFKKNRFTNFLRGVFR